jgi:hypothetical protein
LVRGHGVTSSGLAELTHTLRSAASMANDRIA